MCGKEEQSCKFPGMIAFVVAYLDVIKCDERSRALIDEYIDFIQVDIAAYSFVDCRLTFGPCRCGQVAT